jgi:hypothetical protein
MTEALKRAQQKYKQNNVTKVTIEFYPTDEDIKTHLANKVASGEPKATYIKRLIRADITKEQGN